MAAGHRGYSVQGAVPAIGSVLPVATPGFQFHTAVPGSRALRLRRRRSPGGRVAHLGGSPRPVLASGPTSPTTTVAARSIDRGPHRGCRRLIRRPAGHRSTDSGRLRRAGLPCTRREPPAARAARPGPEHSWKPHQIRGTRRARRAYRRARVFRHHARHVVQLRCAVREPGWPRGRRCWRPVWTQRRPGGPSCASARWGSPSTSRRCSSLW
jgi:hypothetical protein